MGSEGRILGPSGGFHSGVRLSGSASQRVCVSVVFFFISSSKLLVFVISSSIPSFSSELFSLLSSPQFFFLSVSGDGVGAQGLSTGIKSALLNFS